ncbi:MAG: Rne/Rng family ribonuclease [Nitriliruptorales bacterium]
MAASGRENQDGVEGQIARSGTRLAAKQQTRQRGRRRLGRARPSREQAPALAEDVRRAVLQSVPRTMLVTTSKDRTQVAVLEDRTVAEHYVTRKEDVSYVGNIYMARVQNVLPGMEAAFLDIGKGRNGVLYAGEVLYEELEAEDETRLRIEHALKPGQKVLVQVTKDPMGTKGARLTMQLSLAGRYMVLAPGDGTLGISRKLPDDERERLRKILKRIKPEASGVIVRTAAADATEEQLKEDLERLLQKWETVEARAATANALEPVYEEPDLVVRVIRDHFGPEFLNLIADDPDVHTKVQAYLEEVMPDALGKLELYQPAATRKGELPESLFDAYHVNEQLRKALERKVWLPSGGYIVIEKTEAMTIIDVNTGRFTGTSNLEETVLKTNLEAVEEIVRQLRLRDIGGMIIIDFIDMLLKANQDQVVRRLKRELLRDRTKTRVSEVSRLGLVQMTRKNVSRGLLESYSERCPHCEGRGYRLTLESD